jgi:hypothetical protein
MPPDLIIDALPTNKFGDSFIFCVQQKMSGNKITQAPGSAPLKKIELYSFFLRVPRLIHQHRYQAIGTINQFVSSLPVVICAAKHETHIPHP